MDEPPLHLTYLIQSFIRLLHNRRKISFNTVTAAPSSTP